MKLCTEQRDRDRERGGKKKPPRKQTIRQQWEMIIITIKKKKGHVDKARQKEFLLWFAARFLGSPTHRFSRPVKPTRSVPVAVGRRAATHTHARGGGGSVLGNHVCESRCVALRCVPSGSPKPKGKNLLKYTRYIS